MAGLSYEEREIVGQVMGEALPLMTDRQAECLRMQVAGRTQADVACVLGISQRTVCFHVKAALRKVEEVARGYV